LEDVGPGIGSFQSVRRDMEVNRYTHKLLWS
jgi:hypothetical protein